MGVDEVAQLTAKRSGSEPSASATAKGSDRIPRERIRPPSSDDVVNLDVDDKKTRKMDAKQFKELLAAERAPATTLPVANKVMTELAKKSVEPAKPEPKPEPRKMLSTGEMMAQVDEAFADFGPEPDASDVPPPVDELAIPVETPMIDSKPVKKQASNDALAIPVETPMIDSKPVRQQALIVADHRLDTRFAGAIPPITKPPHMKEPPPIEAPKPVLVSVEATPTMSMLALVGILALVILVGILLVLFK